MSSRYALTRWEPEQPAFWQSKGERIAQRNLWISIPALMLAFSIWMLWSVVVVNLNKAGFSLSKSWSKRWWLGALRGAGKAASAIRLDAAGLCHGLVASPAPNERHQFLLRVHQPVAS